MFIDKWIYGLFSASVDAEFMNVTETKVQTACTQQQTDTQ